MSMTSFAKLLCTTLLLVLSLRAEDDERIDRLIADLGAEDFDRREGAAAELERIAEEEFNGRVEIRLQEASGSQDPEVAKRAQDLCLRIRANWDIVLVEERDDSSESWDNVAIRAVDIPTGETVWVAPCRHVVAPPLRLPGAGRLALVRGTEIWEGLDVATGEVLWSAEAAMVDTWSRLGRDVFSSSWHRSLDVVTLNEGGRLWALPVGSRARSGSVSIEEAACSDSKRVFLTLDDRLTAVEKATGREVWSRHGEYRSTTVKAANGLVVVIGRALPWVRGYSAESGDLLWSWMAPEDEHGPGLSLTGLNDDIVTVGTFSSSDEPVVVRAIEWRTGRMMWERRGAYHHGWVERVEPADLPLGPGDLDVWVTEWKDGGYSAVDLRRSDGVELHRTALESGRVWFMRDVIRVIVTEPCPGGDRLTVRAFDAVHREGLLWEVELDYELPDPASDVDLLQTLRRGGEIVVVATRGLTSWVDLLDVETGEPTRVFGPGKAHR